MMMTRVTQAQVGDMFMVRNAGNMIPHATKYGAVLEATQIRIILNIFYGRTVRF